MNNNETTVSDTEQNAFELKWEGRFNEAAGKAKAVWGDLTDDLVTQAEGNLRSFIGLLQKKTGETVEQIEQKINNV